MDSHPADGDVRSLFLRKRRRAMVGVEVFEGGEWHRYAVDVPAPRHRTDDEIFAAAQPELEAWLARVLAHSEAV